MRERSCESGHLVHWVAVGLGLCMVQVDFSEGTCMDGRARPARLRVDTPVLSGLGWSLRVLAADDNEGRTLIGRRRGCRRRGRISAETMIATTWTRSSEPPSPSLTSTSRTIVRGTRPSNVRRSAMWPAYHANLISPLLWPSRRLTSTL